MIPSIILHHTFPFLETIRIDHGVVQLLDAHQRRLSHVFSFHYPNIEPHDLSALAWDDIPSDGIYKCRILYNSSQLHRQFIPYEKKSINSVVFEEGVVNYPFKYSFRLPWNIWADHAQDSQEVIVVSDGLIRESTYANVAFQIDGQWLTPTEPIFHGVMREYLIAQKTITPSKLSISDVMRSDSVRLFNAMMPWDDCVELPSSAFRYAI